MNLNDLLKDLQSRKIQRPTPNVGPVEGRKPIDTKVLQQRNLISATQAALNERAAKMERAFKPGTTTWDGLAQQFGIEIPERFRKMKCNYLTFITFIQDYKKRAVDVAFQVQVRPKQVAEQREANVDLSGYNLTPQQQKALGLYQQSFEAERDDKSNASLLLMKTGKGKTVVGASIVKWLKDNNYFGLKAPIEVFPPVLWLTKKKIVLPTIEKLKRAGLSEEDVLVTNYESLATKRFAPYFGEQEEILFGNTFQTYTWKFLPFVLIICDECQELKKIKAGRTRRVMGFLNGKGSERTRWLMMSATAAEKPVDLTLWLLCTRAQTPLGILDRGNLPAFLRAYSDDPNKPCDLTPIKEAFNRHVLVPPDDPMKVKMRSSVIMLEFRTDEERDSMASAELDYVESCKAIGKNPSSSALGELLRSFTILRRREELLKAPYFAERAIAKVKSGKAAAIAVSYIETVYDIVGHLAQAGFTRDDISIVWGGRKIIREDEVYSTKEFSDILKKAHDLDKKGPFNEMYDFLTTKERSKLKKTITYIKERVWRSESKSQQKERIAWLDNMNLDAQSDKQTHAEVTRFQLGKSKICIFTFQLGVGIDLDHQHPNALPRSVDTTVCYNGNEFIQVNGRFIRIPTLSDVDMSYLFFKGTLAANHVAPILADKVSAINSLIDTGIDLSENMSRAIIEEREGKEIESIYDIEATEIVESVESADDDDEEEEEQ